MTKSSISILFFAMSIVSTQAHASNWKFIGENTKAGSQTFIDVSGIVYNGSYRTVWQKRTQVIPDSDGTSYSITRFKYDCTNRTATLLTYTDYKAGGETVRSRQIPVFQQSAEDVVPDSIGEAILSFVCN